MLRWEVRERFRLAPVLTCMLSVSARPRKSLDLGRRERRMRSTGFRVVSFKIAKKDPASFRNDPRPAQSD